MAPKKAGVAKVTKEAKPRKEKKAKDPDAVRSVLRECLKCCLGPLANH